jgi:hypothetical protein
MPREVVRVFTAGTVIEPGMLEAGRNNYLTAVLRAGDRVGLAYADMTTGEFATTQLNGRRRLSEELARLNPAELLVPDNDVTLYNESRTVSRCPTGALKRGQRQPNAAAPLRRRPWPPLAARANRWPFGPPGPPSTTCKRRKRGASARFSGWLPTAQRATWPWTAAPGATWN